MNIHSRALVDSRAVIGEGCVIGPDAIIDGDVVLGPDCIIAPRAYITGRTTLGARVRVGMGAIIGGEPQDLAYKGAASMTEVGDDTVFREYTTVHRGTKEGTVTRIGKKCYFMTGAHVGHNSQVADEVIMANNTALGGYVEVGTRVFFGGASVVHQNCRIGAYSMIRGMGAMSMDVPPYCMTTLINTLSGLNIVGLKRAGFDETRRRRILRAVRIFFRSGLNRTQAVQVIRADESLRHVDVELLLTFAETTKRGLCTWRKLPIEADPE